MLNCRLQLVFFSVFISFSLVAGRLEKGFEALRIYDYFKAKEIFTKTLSKHPEGAGYGLALIYSRTDNPFHDVTRAHNAILESVWSLPQISEKEKLRLKKLLITEKEIFFLKNYIDSLGFREAEKKGTVAAWNEYLETYCTSSLTKEAVSNRNEIAFRETRIAGTWEAYKNFSDLYPDAIQYEFAFSTYQRLLFEKYAEGKKIASYELFMKEHPESPYVANAEDSIFKFSVPDHNIVEYHSFISGFPKNRNVPDAWKRIYALYTADGKSTTIAQFWIDYPDFPFKETISEDLKLSMTKFYPIRENNRWGFIDSTGETAIPCTYQWVENFSEGIASAGANEKSGFIGKNGKIAIPFEFDEAESFNKGMAQVKRNDKVGLTDRAGHLVVPIMYDEIGDFFDARAVVARDGKYGYIDMFGSEVIPCQYEKAGDFSNGYAYVVDSSKYGYIDHSGNVIIKCEYEWVSDFENGFARVEKDGKFGIIASNGKSTLPCDYSFIGPFKEGFAMVVMDDKCGYIRHDGTFIIPCTYDYDKNLSGESNFYNGEVRVKSKGKCGILDSTGKVVVPFEFDDIFPFENGLAPVKKKDQWGYIDPKIKLIIPYQYDEAGAFDNGIAIVKADDKESCIDTKGKEIIPAEFENIKIENEYLLVNNGKGWGLLDRKGNTILSCNYSKIEFISPTLLRLEMSDESFGYYNISACRFIWKESGVE